MLVPFRKRLSSHESNLAEIFPLDRPLLYLTDSDPWTIRHACEGTQIFGAVGSGKSSGSGRSIAKAFLEAGFGGLVLTAKTDECDVWRRYCAETGRTNSLRIFSPQESHRFNFLQYELRRPGVGGGLTENLVMLFCTVLEVAERQHGQAGRSDEYWKRAMKQLLRNAIDLLVMARGEISLPLLYEVIQSSPQHPTDLADEEWREESLCFQCLIEANEAPKTESQQQDFVMVERFWLKDFLHLAAETRSSVISTFTTMADCFLRGVLRDLFCTDITLVPELTHHGDIIVLDLPIKEYHDLGRFAQVLFKYVWQRATERRDVNANPRPVFLWADEAQFFATSYDMDFLTTARSARACTVFLTQNLPNYYTVFSGERGRSEVDSILGNLQTKIFHQNGDPVTNQWAAEIFAKNWRFRANAGVNIGRESFEGLQTNKHSSQRINAGGSESLEYEVLPRYFNELRKGGFENDLCVDGLVFQGGRRWQATGKNYLLTTFWQDD